MYYLFLLLFFLRTGATYPILTARSTDGGSLMEGHVGEDDIFWSRANLSAYASTAAIVGNSGGGEACVVNVVVVVA